MSKSEEFKTNGENEHETSELSKINMFRLLSCTQTFCLLDEPKFVFISVTRYLSCNYFPLLSSDMWVLRISINYGAFVSWVAQPVHWTSSSNLQKLFKSSLLSIIRRVLIEQSPLDLTQASILSMNCEYAGFLGQTQITFLDIFLTCWFLKIFMNR